MYHITPSLSCICNGSLYHTGLQAAAQTQHHHPTCIHGTHNCLPYHTVSLQAATAAAHDKKAVPAAVGSIGVLAQPKYFVSEAHCNTLYHTVSLQAATAAAHDKKAVPAAVGGIGVLAQQPGMAHEMQAWLLLTGRTLKATKVSCC